MTNVRLHLFVNTVIKQSRIEYALDSTCGKLFLIKPLYLLEKFESRKTQIKNSFRVLKAFLEERMNEWTKVNSKVVA